MISASAASGSVTGGNGAGSSSVGGFVGENDGFITTSSANTSVYSYEGAVGGFVGLNQSSAFSLSGAVPGITQSYASGSVVGGDGSVAGGFAGENLGAIRQAYAFGTVTGGANAYVGGFAGNNDSAITAAYFDTLTSGTNAAFGSASTNTTGVTGKVTADMQAALPSDFDSSVWSIVDGISYPYFTRQFVGTPTVVAGIDSAAGVPAGTNVDVWANGSLQASGTTGANGYYYTIFSATPNTGLLALDAFNNGTYVDAGFSGLLNVSGNGVTINTGQTALSGLDFAIGLTLGGRVASVQQFIAGLDTDLTINATSSFDFTTSIVTPGRLTLHASDIYISGGVQVAGTGTSGAVVVMDATGAFFNYEGADAIGISDGVTTRFGGPGDGNGNQPGAHWLIYSADPSNNFFNGLDSQSVAVWNATYGTVAPGATPLAGDLYLFATQPTLTFGTTGDVSKTYGTDGATDLRGYLQIGGLSVGVSGAFKADTAATALSGMPLLVSAGTDAGADVAGGPYAITADLTGITGLNGYAIGSFSSADTVTVTRAPLTLGLTGTVEKTYDGTVDAASAAGNFDLQGLYAGDAGNLTVSYANASYDSIDHGTGRTVSVGGLAISGTKADNYDLQNSGASGAVGIIDSLHLTAGLTGSVTKTYDATTDASVDTAANLLFTSGSAQNGDSLALLDTGATYDTATHGSGKTVTVTGLSLADDHGGNYILDNATASAAIGSIDVATVTAGLTGNVTKTYDATTAAALGAGNYTLAGVMGADAITVSGTGSYDTATHGSGKTVTASGLVLNGNSDGNYVLASTTISANIGTIDVATLTASLTGSVTKTYDATTAAALSASNYTLAGVMGSDAVTVSGTGSYDTATHGSGKTMTVTGLTLNGNSDSNYVLNNTTASGVIGTIDVATVTAGLTGSVTKIYDTTAAAALSADNYTLTGIAGADALTLNNPASGSYADKNAGTGKVVTVTGLVLNGNSGGNYQLASTTVSGAVGVINAAMVTAGLTGSVTKTYDATTAAIVAAANMTLTGVLAADTGSVALNAPANGAYDNATVGTGKTVTASGLALSGSNAGNYRLSATSASGAIGSVTQAPLTVRANDTARVQGDPDPLFSVSYTGLMGADAASVVSGLTVVSSADSDSEPGAYVLTPTGGTATNYVILTRINGVLTVNSKAGPGMPGYNQAIAALAGKISGYQFGAGSNDQQNGQPGNAGAAQCDVTGACGP